MKLNFELCKICNASNYKMFKSTYDFESNIINKKIFKFFCKKGAFIFDNNEYNSEKVNQRIRIQDITEEEWKDIKKMEVIKIEKLRFGIFEEKKYVFNECPYYLEHLVEN